MILTSVITEMGEGGVQMVNRLILDAAAGVGLPGIVISLHDRPGAPFLSRWPGSCAAAGSKMRFTWASLARRSSGGRGPLLVTHAGLIPVGRLAKGETTRPLLLFLHGVEAWQRPSKVRAWGLAAVDRFVANSEFTLRKFRDVHPELAAVPADVCPLPARTLGVHREDPTRPPRATRRILVVGRLWGRGLAKGQSQLISILPELRRDFADVELWIVGEGDGRRDLEAQAQGSRDASAIHFTGRVSDAELDRHYADADVYAMPSEGEGFGLVFAEAMAHGLPCIASRYDAGAEVVRDGESGVLVDPHRADDILAALRLLFGNDDLRHRMGEAARRRAVELYSLERFNRRMASLLRHGRMED